MCRLLRIAVLEADEPVGETKKKYGGFGTIFQELLEAGASRVGETGSAKPLLQVSSFDVVTRQEYPDLESIDAVLISGSSMCGIAETQRRPTYHQQDTTRSAQEKTTGLSDL